jgi:hypothetical protein
MYYNFVRIHKTLRTTPAMAAKVTKRLWEIGDIVDEKKARLHMKKGNEDGTEFRSLHSVYCRERRKRDSCGGLMGS